MQEEIPGLDRPSTVRHGEELDLVALKQYAQGRLGDDRAEWQVSQFPSGFSNLTYMITIGEIEWVLRRPPVGSKVKSAHDMGREFRVLTALEPLFSKIPKPLFFCEDESVLGAPFYIMERVRGVILRGKTPAGLKLDEAQFHAISQTFVDTLCEIHMLDPEAPGIAGLGKPQGYVRRQVEGWVGRYQKATLTDFADLDRLAAWLLNQQPTHEGVAVIHNDFKYDNLVLNPDNLAEVKAILDWEMATLGDPLMDLGTSLAYWTEQGDPPELKMLGLTAQPGNLNRQQLFDRYQDRRGVAIETPSFYIGFGFFKIAVIALQIYLRFKQGLTTDPRFAVLGKLARVCGTLGWRAADSNRISQLGD